MARTLLVEGKKTFKITVPDEAKVTFGPWSPGAKNEYGGQANGTLRIYENKSAAASILGVWSGVTGFREVSALDYEEKTEIRTGKTVWHSDKKGFKVESEETTEEEWKGEIKQLNAAEGYVDEEV